MTNATMTAIIATTIVPPRPVFAIAQATAPTRPAAGNVTSHAMSMRPATLQFSQSALFAKTRADDGAGAYLRRGKSEAQMRRSEDGRRRSGFGGESLRRVDFGQTLAQRADDTPAAHVGTEGDGQAADSDDPELRTGAGSLSPHGNKRQGDNAHGLLRIVRTVGKSDQARRNRLSVPEPRLYLFFIELSYDGEYHFYRHKCRQTCNNGRNKRRNEHFRNHCSEIDAFYASANDNGAHEAAKQGMRRTRRQADKPGEKIPDDGAYKTGEYEFWAYKYLLLVNDASPRWSLQPR